MANPGVQTRDKMKSNQIISTSLSMFFLASLGCSDTVSGQNETELRALRVDLEKLRKQIETTHGNVEDNRPATVGWEDDVSALWTIITQNQSRLETLESADLVSEEWVSTAISAGTGALGELATRVESLESNFGDTAATIASTAALAEKVVVNADGDVIFRDTNVFIQNGASATGVLNGKGNLVIGYNLTTGALDRSGSHNLIIGDGHTYTGHSGVAAGIDHQIKANFNAAIGGIGSRIEGEYASALGGQYNHVSGQYAIAVGGKSNTANGANSATIGGQDNITGGLFSTAAGGQSNTVTGDYSTVAGGSMNTIEGDSATVAGGHFLDVDEAFSVAMVDELDSVVEDLTASMGLMEEALEASNSVQNLAINELEEMDTELRVTLDDVSAEMETNTSNINVLQVDVGDASTGLNALNTTVEAQGLHLDDFEVRVSRGDELMAFVQIDSRGDVVFSDTNLVVTNGSGSTQSTNGKGNLIMGYNAYTDEERTGSHNIIVGDNNTFTSTASLIVGDDHSLAGHGSAIIGGELNLLSGDASVIIGGYTTDIAANLATALGGAHNTVTGTYATAIGGYSNTASGDFSTAGPGRENTASGEYSSVLGGALNSAIGLSSSVSGGYAITVTEEFGMGAVSELLATVTAEQGRLDSTVDHLEAVSTQSEALLVRADDGDVRADGFDSGMATLEASDATQTIGLSSAAAGRADLVTDLENVRDDFEGADASIIADIINLSSAHDDLTSAIDDDSSGLPALGGRIRDLEASETDHGARIGTLETSTDAMDLSLGLATAAIADGAGRLDTAAANIDNLEAHQVQADALLAFVSVDTDGDVVFTGTNIRIVNGTDDTHLSNEKGNLILGYDGSDSYAEDRSGSHNIVVGDHHAYAGTAGLVSGENNALNGTNAVAIGGSDNTVSGDGGVAIGGTANQVTQTGAAAIGGQFSTVSGGWAAVFGGAYHEATAINSTIVGGHTNTASGEHAVVIGGYANSASAAHATTLGGSANTAIAPYGVTPFDALSDAVDGLESFTSALGSDVGAEIATNTASIASLEISAEDVDARVSENATAMTENGASISAHGSDISSLQGDVASLSTEDLTLWESIDDLNTSRDVADTFLNYVTVSPTGDIVFEDTNLVVRNSSGSTDGTTDGKGNLIIGYNEIDVDSVRTGSHNLILGMANSYSAFSGIIAGFNNVQLGEYASILGGTENLVSGNRAVVIAGQNNIASAINSVVIAGTTNEAEAQSAVVISGISNVASGIFSTVVAGNANDTTGPYSAVVSGDGNEATGQASVVIGGQVNLAAGRSSAILAGKENVTNGSNSGIVAGWTNRTGAQHAAVLSGYDNDADGEYSSILGGFKSDTTHSGSAVAGAYIFSSGLYTVDY
jgi:hypothetical protein